MRLSKHRPELNRGAGSNASSVLEWQQKLVSMFVSAHTFTCTYEELVCEREHVCDYVCVVQVCRKRGGAGAASHGVFCGMSLLSPSRSHEMGKHEIKVEKTHKGVGRRMTRVWVGVGRGKAACSCTPGPQKSTRPHSSMKRALMRTWLFRLRRIKTPNPIGCQHGASMSYFITLSQHRHQLQPCFPLLPPPHTHTHTLNLKSAIIRTFPISQLMSQRLHVP